MNDKVVKLALDAIHNKVAGNFSADQTSETLREAFIEANGGSTKIGMKTFRDHPELYQIVEAIIPAIAQEGFKGDEFFMNLVDYRNLALGDDIDFWAEDNSLFVVSDAAHGTQGIRRQRLDVGTKVDVTTQLKVIKVYEELNRLLSGRVDFNTFVDKVGKSMVASVNSDIYTALSGITSSTTGLNSTYVKSGTFAEDDLLGIIDHVEASTGMTAQIVGTRTALRKITSAVVSDEAKSDMYALGYYGKFNGTPLIVAKQRHAVGTDTFLLSDSIVWVIASNDKPIKVVDVGEGLMVDSDAKSDFTKEFLYGQQIGTAVLASAKMGVYTIS